MLGICKWIVLNWSGDILVLPWTSESFLQLCGSIGMDGLIDEGCDCDSGKEHEERIEGGEGEHI